MAPESYDNFQAADRESLLRYLDQYRARAGQSGTHPYLRAVCALSAHVTVIPTKMQVPSRNVRCRCGHPNCWVIKYTKSAQVSAEHKGG